MYGLFIIWNLLVFEILVRILNNESWKEAFEHTIPKRKIDEFLKVGDEEQEQKSEELKSEDSSNKIDELI